MAGQVPDVWRQRGHLVHLGQLRGTGLHRHQLVPQSDAALRHLPSRKVPPHQDPGSRLSHHLLRLPHHLHLVRAQRIFPGQQTDLPEQHLSQTWSEPDEEKMTTRTCSRSPTLRQCLIVRCILSLSFCVKRNFEHFLVAVTTVPPFFCFYIIHSSITTRQHQQTSI